MGDINYTSFSQPALGNELDALWIDVTTQVCDEIAPKQAKGSAERAEFLLIMAQLYTKLRPAIVALVAKQSEGAKKRDLPNPQVNVVCLCGLPPGTPHDCSNSPKDSARDTDVHAKSEAAPSSREKDLLAQFKYLLFRPVHIDHQNREPDGITITKEGKLYYLDELVKIAAAWHTQQVEIAVLKGRLVELDLLEQAINQGWDMNKYKL
jgi:hypothetical protein